MRGENADRRVNTQLRSASRENMLFTLQSQERAALPVPFTLVRLPGFYLRARSK